jgi:hypothetical protein
MGQKHFQGAGSSSQSIGAYEMSSDGSFLPGYWLGTVDSDRLCLATCHPNEIDIQQVDCSDRE